MKSNDSPIYAITVPPGSGRVFLAREDGLFYRDPGSTDWVYVYRTLLGDLPLPTLAVAYSPNFLVDGTLLAGAAGAILCSADGGDTWQITRLDAPAGLVCDVAFSPCFTQDGTLFALTTDDGVFCSYDAGSTWMNWNFGLLDARGFKLAVSPRFELDRTVWIGTSSGLYRSRNGGKSWQPLELPVEDQPVTSLGVQAQDSGALALWAGMASAGLLLSPDGGSEWLAGNTDFDGCEVGALCSLPGGRGMAALVEQTLWFSENLNRPFRPWLGAGSDLAAINSLPDARDGALLVAVQGNGEIYKLGLE